MGKKIYLCKPNQKKVCVLNSIRDDTVRRTQNLLDISEISFEVDKYINIDDVLIVGNGYDLIGAYMEVYLEGVGYFQLQEPSVEMDGDREYKTVIGYSLEKELVGKRLIGFKINCGTADSLEMLANNNVNSLNMPDKYITFYNEENSQLSLLHLVIEKVPSWTIGYVDPSLKNLKLSYNIDNSNIYSFLTNDISRSAECIFKFDTINKKINVYNKYHIGNDTGIYVSLRNLANKISVQCNEDSIYTQMSVFGADDLDIRAVNFGSNQIENLEYLLSKSQINLTGDYQSYIQTRESKREEYINLFKTQSVIQEKISELKNRVPNDGCFMDWSQLTIEELERNKTYYNALITSSQISIDSNPQYINDSGNLDDYIPWKNSDGDVDHESYIQELGKTDSGAYTYEEIIKYILPNIETAIVNYDKIPEDKEDYKKDYITEWEHYGLIESQGKLSSYEEELKTLADYKKTWDELSEEEKTARGNNQELYNDYHNMYVETSQLIEDLKTYILQLENEISTLENELEATKASIVDLVSSVELKVGNFGFTEDDIKTLSVLYNDTDYTNENILVTSLDSKIEDRINIQKELYQDGVLKLAEISKPQYSFNVDIDNIYEIEEFEILKDQLDVGNFIRLEVDDGVVEKLRIISIVSNPCDKTNLLELQFSNMINRYSSRDDFSYLFNEAISSSSKGTSSIGSGSKDSIELSTDVLNLIANSRVFQNKFDNLRLDSIVSSEGVFNQIIVDKALITTAEIEKLLAEKAYITKLEADDLYANKGEFGSISATVGKIDTLMFGSASGDVIQTNFSNSVIAQLGEAQIQSAMIAGLDAGKINAGSIYTNKVHILGDEDGRLSIIDNTIAISDGTKTRVQIGKDANDDYNMYVWDNQGNIMFDALGLTEKGINRPVIRDDVVRDDANISASKLDIDTLFTVINEDGTHSLKSSKVYLDEQGQTLEVAFKEIKSSSLQGVEVQYALSDSATVPPTDGWSSDTPTWVQGKYMWQKTVTTNANGDEISSAPTCIQGAKGEDGTGVAILGSYDTVADLTNAHPIGNVGDGYMVSGDLYVWDSVATSWRNVGQIQGEQGIGVKDVVDEYYLSSSSLTQTGGEWSTESPTWQNGFYIWTRSKITWTDNSISWTSPVLATMFNSAMSDLHTMGTELEAVQGKISSKVWQQDIDNLKIGGRNLILKSDFSGLSNLPDIWSVENDVAIAYSTAVGVTSNSAVSIELSVSDYILNCSNQTALLSIEYFVEEEITYGTTSPWVGAQIAFYSGNTVIKAYGWYGNKGFPTTVSDSWNKFSRTISMDGLENITRVCIRFYFRDATGKVKFRHPKLEMGDKATDWTPAPEDADDKISTLTTQYSTLEQTVNEVDIKVASHETQISNIQNMKIGGRNLLKNSKTFSTLTQTTTNEWVVEENDDYNTLTINSETAGWAECRVPLYTSYNELTGDVTVSFEFYESTEDLLVIALGVYNSSGSRLSDGTNTSVSDSFTIIDISDNWKRATYIYPAKYIAQRNNIEGGAEYRLQFKKRSGKTGEIRIRKPKMEIGNKATDWTPAPEDIDSEITTVEDSVSELKIQVDKIESTVSETCITKDQLGNYATVSQMNSAIEQKANSITATVSETYTTKEEFSGLKVGGRNYIINSKEPIVLVGEGINKEVTNNNIFFPNIDIPKKLEGNKVTVSCEVDANITEGSCDFRVSYSFGLIYQFTSNIYTEKLIFSFILSSNEERTDASAVYLQGSFVGTITLKNIKLEIGNKATDWTPAPEDIDSEITTLSNELTIAENNISTLRVDVDGIDANVSEYKSITDGKISTIESNVSNLSLTTEAFKTTVSNTYTTKEEFVSLVGGRNYIINSANDVKLTGLGLETNATNSKIYCSNIDIAESLDGKEMTVSFDLDNNITQGSCRLSINTPPSYKRICDFSTETNTENKRYSFVFTMPDATHTNTSLLYIQGKFTGTIALKNIKLEIGNKATEWTPAPEDTSTRLTTVETVATQTADKFNWIVKSGTSIADFTLTDRMAILTADIISLNGNVKISGDMIVDGAITTKKINVNELSAISANLGTVTAGIIQSANYVSGSTGMKLTLSDGVWDSKYFKIASDGKIAASGGTIGGWSVSDTSISSVEDDTGNGVFLEKGTIRISHNQYQFATILSQATIQFIKSGLRLAYIAPVSSTASGQAGNPFESTLALVADSSVTTSLDGDKVSYGKISLGYTTPTGSIIECIQVAGDKRAELEQEGYNLQFPVIAKFTEGLNATEIIVGDTTTSGIKFINADMFVYYNGAEVGSLGVQSSMEGGEYYWRMAFTKKIVCKGGVYIGGHSHLENNISLRSYQTDGTVQNLIALNSSNVTHIGSTAAVGDVNICTGTGQKFNFHIGGTEYLKTPVSIALDGIHVRGNSGIRGVDSDGIVRNVMVYNSNSSLVTIGTQGASNAAVNVTISTPTLSIITSKAFTSNRTMTVSSDSRVKTNISTLSDRYTKILDMLDAKTFRYTYDTDYKLNCGFIAQDVLSSLSECGLTTSEFGGFADVYGDGSHYALDYTQFIPILWQEVKKLRQQVKELKGENS